MIQFNQRRMHEINNSFHYDSQYMTSDESMTTDLHEP